ncbi:MAG: hypothetical protein RLZZ383_2622 [Pseudomonadota bacterium]|jgi:uncharacterized protein involved in cysteine biosynthesis
MRQGLHGLMLWWRALSDIAQVGPYRTALKRPILAATAVTLGTSAVCAWWAGPFATAWAGEMLASWLSQGRVLDVLSVTLGLLAGTVAALVGGLIGFAVAQVAMLPWLESLALDELRLRAPAQEIVPASGWRLVWDVAYGLLCVALDVATALALMIAAYGVALLPAVGPPLTAVAVAGVGGLFVVRQATDPALAALQVPWGGRWRWLTRDPALTAGFVLGGTLMTLIPLAFVLLPAVSALAGSRYVAASASQAPTTR